MLSGDVHHAYAAELLAPADLTSRVHQLTVSPLHNQAPHPIRVGFKIGWSRGARRFTERLARFARAEPTRLEWQKQAGPFFGNQIGELVLDGPLGAVPALGQRAGGHRADAGARHAGVRRSAEPA